MSIELNCPQCSKLIRAPDNAGGKHGKCPYCKGKVYIPMPADESEEIGLAPIDEADEQHERELKRESARYSSAVSREMDAPPEKPGDSERADGPPAAAPDDIDEAVGQFILAMRDSRLEEADRIVEALKSAGAHTYQHVETMLADPSSPPIGNIPKPLFQGFLKTLLERLG